MDIRFCVQRVANVDTVNESASAHIFVMLYWSDTRLVGWKEGMALPLKLWTPRLDWENSLEKKEDVFMQPILTNTGEPSEPEGVIRVEACA